MPDSVRPTAFRKTFSIGLVTLLLASCAAPPAPKAPTRPTGTARTNTPLPTPAPATSRVMLGIDVLADMGFAPLQGKRIGLLTHRAGVNRRGERTVDVLRRAPNVNLVALFAPEHGIDTSHAAEKAVGNTVDPTTGLPVFSLYEGHVVKPSAAQLSRIDALVVDLQDIGTRSYTFVSVLRSAMEACFEAGKEVIVLDRPNPLGGLKVDGPPLDANLMSDVGRYRVPYVHGMTIGELAQMVRTLPAPDGLAISATARARAKLTVIPMRGWTRSMRWPDTGLKWIPTSTWITDWETVQGYPMVGLGCIIGGFTHGIGTPYPFRFLHHDRISDAVLVRELRALNLPGLQFEQRATTGTGGRPATGVYVRITNYNAWEPTRLNFELMRLACRIDGTNPFATATNAQRRSFMIHVGSEAFYENLAKHGARTNIALWQKNWRQKAVAFQQQSRRFWLYR